MLKRWKSNRSAGGAERQVAEFVEDDEIGAGKSRRDLAGFALKLLLFESVDEFDGGEEADALIGSDAMSISLQSGTNALVQAKILPFSASPSRQAGAAIARPGVAA